MRSRPAILVLAAGASARMRGADKLLMPVDGVPLLLRAVRAACAAAAEVLVALPADDRARTSWLTDLPVTRLPVGERAMGASIAAGAGAVRADSLMVHLADMPEIDADALDCLAEAWRRGAAPILRATTSDGRPGHPVVFDRSLYPDLRELSADSGARELLRTRTVETYPLPGNAAVVDLDTPEAWAEWRARTGR